MPGFQDHRILFFNSLISRRIPHRTAHPQAQACRKRGKTARGYLSAAAWAQAPLAPAVRAFAGVWAAASFAAAWAFAGAFAAARA